MLRTLIAIALVLSVVVMLTGFAPVAAQIPETVRPEKPINCEEFQAHLDHVMIDWSKNREASLILIVRLGTGERDRKLNRARLSWVEDYLKSHDVKYLLAEGERVKGFGRFEVYLGGRLAMSIPLVKGSRKLCWGRND